MIAMSIKPNDSPLFGKDGDKFTYLQLKERLIRESENDVSLRVDLDNKQKDSILAFGRGDLHLGILVEKMRREGYEMCLNPPQVIYKDINGERHEPIEEVSIEIGNEHTMILIDSIQNRKGLLINSEELGDNKSRVIFEAPSRGLFGFRPYMIALSKGHCIIQR
jgi:GTP-binding protein